MPYNLTPQRHAARERVIAQRDDVTRRYTNGESLLSLAHVYNVSDSWLRDRFAEWDIPLRTRSESVKAAWRHVRKTEQVSTFRRPAD
ncbi:hypothetical protein [Streptomyces sp. NPDC001889]